MYYLHIYIRYHTNEEMIDCQYLILTVYMPWSHYPEYEQFNVDEIKVMTNQPKPNIQGDEWNVYITKHILINTIVNNE